jgi:hypothetical protein
MRASFAISVLIHAAIVLWLLLAPGAKPFDPAHADAILVELMPQDDPTKAEHEPPKPDAPKPDVPKPEAPKAAAEAQSKPAPKAQEAVSPEDQAQAAARLAQLLDAPVSLPLNLAAPPSESKTRLAPDLIAKLKAQVGKCFVPLTDPPDVPDFLTGMRIALRRDGSLAADPSVTFGPASSQGIMLKQRAVQALRQCQPYAFLPADKYADWRVIDLVFAFDGPADDVTANGALHRTNTALQNILSGR